MIVNTGQKLEGRVDYHPNRVRNMALLREEEFYLRYSIVRGKHIARDTVANLKIGTMQGQPGIFYDLYSNGHTQTCWSKVEALGFRRDGSLPENPTTYLVPISNRVVSSSD